MTKLIVDATVEAKLFKADGPLEVCDQSGKTLGYFHPLVELSGSPTGKIQSPFPVEEIERRRQQRTGKSLAEILQGLR